MLRNFDTENIQLLTTLLLLLGAIFYVIYRGRQAKAVGTTIRSLKDDRKKAEERRCPHYQDKEIKAAKRVYVRPDCAQVDPANEIEFRKFASVREPIFQSVKRYIDSEQKRHLLVLADSGMGKTTFCLNFFDYIQTLSSSHDVALISLARSNSSSAIANIDSKRTTTLILDALDEDPKAIANGADRLTEIMDLCADFPLVIVTCRSHFFENDAAIPVRTGISQIVPRSAGRTSSYEFARLYLLPFDEVQIDDFLKKSFPFFILNSFGFRRKARDLIAAIPDLSARPMLLALVPELVRKRIEPKEIYELYEYMVQQWLLREEKWVDANTLSKASTEIAFHLSLTKQQSGIDRLNPSDVLAMGLTSEGLAWRHLTTRSLLNRDSEGNLKFAHRSIMEFLVVKGALQGDDRALSLVWTDFMRELLLSYGNLKPSDEKAAALLSHLIKSRSATRFPFADPVSQPLLRSKAEFEAIANPLRRTCISRHLIPGKWVKSSVTTTNEGGQILIEDKDHGFIWRALDFEDSHISQQLDLYRVSMHDFSRSSPHDGFELPSFPEFLTLLRIQRLSGHCKFINPNFFYWLGDSSDRGSHMLVSINGVLEHPSATTIVTAIRDEGRTSKLSLYALDPYRQNVRTPSPKAFEVKIKRRDVLQTDIRFSN